MSKQLTDIQFAQQPSVNQTKTQIFMAWLMQFEFFKMFQPKDIRNKQIVQIEFTRSKDSETMRDTWRTHNIEDYKRKFRTEVSDITRIMAISNTPPVAKVNHLPVSEVPPYAMMNSICRKGIAVNSGIGINISCLALKIKFAPRLQHLMSSPSACYANLSRFA